MRPRVLGIFFTLACVLVAQTPLQVQLEKQLRNWQKRMGLDDWNLSVQVVRKSALDKDTWGSAEWDPDTKSGTINVLDPQDYNLRGTELRRDMECTIVHELVHIQVAPLEAKDPDAQEEVVNRLMTALLNRSCPN